MCVPQYTTAKCAHLMLVLLLLLGISPRIATASGAPRVRSASATPCSAPTPVRPFTVQAYQSPYPTGAGLTGMVMTARGGNFWLPTTPTGPSTSCDNYTPCPPGNETVLWVDDEGHAYMDSLATQRVYLNTVDGTLGYESPSLATPAGASFVYFLHLGQGTTAYSGSGNSTSEAPGTFQWIGSNNNVWFACPRPGPGYQILKLVSTGNTIINTCTSVSLSALDWSGQGAAAGEYI